ncbi:flotillin family protein [Undibacterium sp. Jales W-56]|uniref:SPFH domain-containing protein n=1 Tax=Undibacterium sp. Jales W-56 TaxID=2897325 RepID=UPI0021D17519|nr:SPFH domain-containing protein [Undibacterium sp. Jales W-56]MCU6433639.1 flotillin family protein [Undibacterium sp. Jales W-56]
MFEIILAIIVVITILLLYTSNVLVYISNEKIGIVEKKWSASGSLQHGFIALNGEAGFQPEVLRGGFHVFFPFQYAIHRHDLVTIQQGTLAYVFARDGQAMAPTQNLACNKTANDFTDVRGFLTHDGQKGLQRKILREGTYAINLAQFVVLTTDKVYALPLPGDGNVSTDGEVVGQLAEMLGELRTRNGFQPLVIRDDKLAVITTHEGQSLPEGTIVAPVVGADPHESNSYHHDFQNPEVFIESGGYKGRQLQVLVEGTYYLNARFATYEIVEKRVVPVGYVGVVVSYTGKAGNDVTGDAYRHGELVGSDEKGVQVTPLLPGKYALNPYAKRVIDVPTTNFILKWQSGAVGSHELDKHLSEVSLITKDAFEPDLPLSVVVNIDYKMAPLVIQRFGDIQKLVEQTLDPMVAAYFKNIGQGKTLIELLQERSDIQERAKAEMRKNFEGYNLTLNEVLIGTPRAKNGDTQIEVILKQLRERQVSREQLETYKTKETAAVQERILREAEAKAKQQTAITESELAVKIAENQGSAAVQKAIKSAEEVRQAASGAADAKRTLANAEAYQLQQVGEAQAKATRLNVEAYGGPELQFQQTVLLRFAEAIEKGHIAMVPSIQTGGSGSASAVDAFLALAAKDLLNKSEKKEVVIAS